MGEAIGELLPTAVAVMVSPAGVVAALWMLATPRGRVNGLAYLGGWLASLSLVGAVALSIAGGLGASDGRSPATWASLLLLAVGVVLVLLAVKQWRDRPRVGDAPKPPPTWLSALDRFGPVKAAGTGVLVGGLNPKNVLLITAAAVAIAETGISPGKQVAAYAIFVVIASLGIVIPVVLSLVFGARAQQVLAAFTDWIAGNSAVIMTVVLLIFGVTLIGDAITALST